jgi:hypothetical protein
MSATPHDGRNVVHEETDVNVRAILGFGLGLLAVAVVIHLFVWMLFAYFSSRVGDRTRQYPLAAGQETRLPPEPRLQANPRGELRDLRAAEDQLLASYGWVDRDAGIIRIPIDVAMRLTVQRGLPTRPATGAKP